jgi:hypothetical protein
VCSLDTKKRRTALLRRGDREPNHLELRVCVQHKLIIKLARAGWQVLHSVEVGSLVQQWHAVRLSASLALS